MKVEYQEISLLMSSLLNLLECQRSKLLKNEIDSELANLMDSFIDGFVCITSLEYVYLDKVEEICDSLVSIVESYQRNDNSNIKAQFKKMSSLFLKWSEEFIPHFAMKTLEVTYSSSLIEYKPNEDETKKIICLHDKNINLESIGRDLLLQQGLENIFSKKVDYITSCTTKEMLLNTLLEDSKLRKEYAILPNMLSMKSKIETFDLLKFLNLRTKDITIISDDCWGAYQYKQLGIKYHSPFIWLFVSNTKDYLKLLRNIREYLSYELNFVKLPNVNYPVAELGDILIHFNHYKSEDDAREKWYERTQRINWENIAVKAMVHSEEEAKEFDALPFNKKLCFTPSDYGINSGVPMKEWYNRENQDKYEFYQFVHLFSDDYIDIVKWINGDKDYKKVLPELS